MRRTHRGTPAGTADAQDDKRPEVGSGLGRRSASGRWWRRQQCDTGGRTWGERCEKAGRGRGRTRAGFRGRQCVFRHRRSEDTGMRYGERRAVIVFAAGRQFHRVAGRSRTDRDGQAAVRMRRHEARGDQTTQQQSEQDDDDGMPSVRTELMQGEAHRCDDITAPSALLGRATVSPRGLPHRRAGAASPG